MARRLLWRGLSRARSASAWLISPWRAWRVRRSSRQRLRRLRPGSYFVSPMPQYLAQFATMDRVSEFLNGDAPPEQDPAWSEFGFDNVAEYSFWAPRLCGIVCAKMVIDSNAPRPAPSVATLTRQGLDLGGYQVHDAEGSLVDRGWFYRPLVELARQFDFEGAVQTSIPVEELCIGVLDNRVFVVSVHPGVIRGDLDVAPQGARGGHLVVVVGFEWGESGLAGFYVHNPSGRTREFQERAFIPLMRFTAAFAGRGFWLRPKGRAQQSGAGWQQFNEDRLDDSRPPR